MKYLRLLLPVLLIACQPTPKEATTYDFPSPVDTKSKPITYQEIKVFDAGDVFATNDFAGARLNEFTMLNDTLYRATISPENTPINHSPWYAFKLWSKEVQTVHIELNYTEHNHRYPTKLSIDGDSWTELDSANMSLALDSVNAFIKLEVGPDTLWVAAQEVISHQKVGEWASTVSRNEMATLGSAGSSVEGRDMYYLSVTNGDVHEKPAVVILSRQHPPEVTGFMCMQAFVETILSEGGKNGFLDKYRVMVYPLMNPDGVDLGHFRHNTGGVDLNRDWAYYNQPEVKQVANHIVRETAKHKNDVVLGLDFHSTWEDVYYTFDESLSSTIPEFTGQWLERIRMSLGVDSLNIEPSGLGAPVSKGWFYTQFGAESITYEIGDKTPRDYIRKKGEVSARAMMEVLMKD